jgi:hypothetical protein
VAVYREYTTLQVATKIVRAIAKARRRRATESAQAAAVFQVLRETSTWFTHVHQDAAGIIDGEAPRTPLRDGRPRVRK